MGHQLDQTLQMSPLVHTQQHTCSEKIDQYSMQAHSVSRHPDVVVPAILKEETTLIKEAHIARFCLVTCFLKIKMNLMVQLNGIAVDEMKAELCED